MSLLLRKRWTNRFESCFLIKTKLKRTGIYPIRLIWQRWQDSNLRMQQSKCCVLPLDDTAVCLIKNIINDLMCQWKWYLLISLKKAICITQIAFYGVDSRTRFASLTWCLLCKQKNYMSASLCLAANRSAWTIGSNSPWKAYLLLLLAYKKTVFLTRLF